MYSSRHTTHSTCRPVYLRRQTEEAEPDFSPFAESMFRVFLASAVPLRKNEERDGASSGRLREPSNGEVGETGPGLEDREELAADEGVGIVW